MSDTLEIKTTVKPAANRAEVIARLRAHEVEIRALLATALYLYGSAARDEMSDNSDVDVFVDYDPDGPYSFVELLQGGEYLQTVLGRNVDFTTRDGLHPRLRDRIVRSSIQVF